MNKKSKTKRKVIICVTGTPGTGKTELSKLIKEKTGLKHINVNREANKLGLIIGYDKKRKVDIVNEALLSEKVREIAKKTYYGVIVDSHISYFTSPKMVNLCILCRCELKELQKRLKKRGYSREKIKENLEAEIFNVCGEEALKIGHRIIEIDCSGRLERNEAVKGIIKRIKREISKE